MKKILFSTLLTLFFFVGMITSKGQSAWKELRSYGVNSYTSSAIHGLCFDDDQQIEYASIGSEIFKWKGGNTSWEAIGTQLPLQANGIIYSVATDKSHNVYAAGWFTNASGRCYVAKASYTNFSNNQWTELGNLNASGPIYSVIADAGGNIYAAGAFINSLGQRYVAKWDGTSWSELGSGANALRANNYINALCTDAAGNIYAAGDFTNASGKRYVAKWNGTAWSETGGLNVPGFAASIKTLASDNNGNVYTAGQFINTGGNTYVAKWDGTAWAELGSGITSLHANDIIYSVKTDLGGNVLAAGNFTNTSGKRYVAKWNGQSWSEMGTNISLGANDAIYALSVDNSNNRVFTAGEFTNQTGLKLVKNYSLSQNGWAETAATGVGGIDGSYVGQVVSTDDGDTVYAINVRSADEGHFNVGRWDGKSWSIVGNLDTYPSVDAIAIDHNGNLFAAYDYYSFHYVDKWNGTSWDNVGNSTSFFQNGHDYGNITKMLTDAAGNLYATSTIANTKGKYYIAKWDGTAWSELGTGANSLDSEEPVSAMTIDNKGNIYATIYKYFDYHIAKWDGTSWSFLESGQSADISLNNIRALAADSKGNVYSGFSNWNGSYFRKWDGTKWTIFSPATSEVLITDKNDDVYTIEDSLVKKWTNNEWQTVGDDTINKFRASSFLYANVKGDLFTRGNWNDINPPGVAKLGFAGAVLPVSVTRFTLVSEKRKVVLNWNVAFESDHTEYMVERSTDGRTFKPIGSVLGNKSSQYKYTDETAQVGISYYRIGIRDEGSNTTYTAIKSIRINVPVTLYPNPVVNTLYTAVPLSSSAPVTLFVTDMQGRVVLQRAGLVNSGLLKLNVEALRPGNYVLLIRQGTLVYDGISFIKGR